MGWHLKQKELFAWVSPFVLQFLLTNDTEMQLRINGKTKRICAEHAWENLIIHTGFN
jgi:hypothetical protein